MALTQTDYFLDAYEQFKRRDASLNVSDMELPLRSAFFDITLKTGFITVADDYILAPLPVDAFIIPNLSFLVGVSGTASGAFTLEKIPTVTESEGTLTYGTPSALSGSVTIATNGTAVVLGAATGATTGFPVLNKGEYLNLTITTATNLAAGAVIRLVVTYLPK